MKVALIATFSYTFQEVRMEKENIAVIFGGKSAEHDISIITGLQAFANIDGKKFNAIPLYISRDGRLLYGKKLGLVETFANFDITRFNSASFCMGRPYLYIGGRAKAKQGEERFKKSIKIDCAVVCCHGLNGEDGTLQGVLELSEIPFTCCTVLSSALCMDKVIMKYLLKSANILTPNFTYFEKTDYYLNSQQAIERICKDLFNISAEGFVEGVDACYVKPANLGSSIGISKCKRINELEDAIEIAVNYDSKVIVEESIENATEVNCAVLGNADYQIASNLEYPKSWSEFLNFDEKYTQREEAAGKVINNTKETENEKVNVIKTKKLSEELEKQVQEIAKKAFKIFGCRGVVRVDFLVQNEKVYLNELNSIPGSLAFYLFKEQGYDFAKLLNRLIDIAKKEYEEKKSNRFSYQSNALANFSKNKNINKYTK